MSQQLKVYYNNREISNLTNKDGFLIRKAINNSFCTINLFGLQSRLLNSIMPYGEIDIRYSSTGKKLFSGLVLKVEVKDIYFCIDTEDIQINCVDYKELLKFRNVEIKDYQLEGMKAGEVVRHFLRFLNTDGITAGEIQDGVDLSEVENLDNFDSVSMYELLDYLADLSHFMWGVDYDKRLYFAKEKPALRHWGSIGRNYNIVPGTDRFYNVNNISLNLNDYINKVFIIGGEPEDDIDEKHLTEDGYIKYMAEDRTSQVRLSSSLGKSGVVGKTIYDPEITTLKRAQELGDYYLKTKCNKPLSLEASTDYMDYEVGDYIFFDYPRLGLEDVEMFIYETEITYFLDEIHQKLKLTSQRQYNSVRDSFFIKYNSISNRRKLNKTIIKDNSPIIDGEKLNDCYYIFDFRSLKPVKPVSVDSKYSRVTTTNKRGVNIYRNIGMTGFPKLVVNHGLEGKIKNYRQAELKFEESDVSKKTPNKLPFYNGLVLLNSAPNYGVSKRTQGLYSTSGLNFENARMTTSFVRFRIDNWTGNEYIYFKNYNDLLAHTGQNKVRCLVKVNNKPVTEITRDTFKGGGTYLIECQILLTKGQINKYYPLQLGDQSYTYNRKTADGSDYKGTATKTPLTFKDFSIILENISVLNYNNQITNQTTDTELGRYLKNTAQIRGQLMSGIEG